MSRRNEAVEEISEETEVHTAPKTVGDVFPGLPGVVAGVLVHGLPLGLIEALIVGGIETEIARCETSAAQGLSAKEQKDEHTEAKNRGRGYAVSAFSLGLLPSDVPD